MQPFFGRELAELGGEGRVERANLEHIVEDLGIAIER